MRCTKLSATTAVAHILLVNAANAGMMTSQLLMSHPTTTTTETPRCDSAQAALLCQALTEQPAIGQQLTISSGRQVAVVRVQTILPPAGWTMQAGWRIEAVDAAGQCYTIYT